jgi:hypothetical protein
MLINIISLIAAGISLITAVISFWRITKERENSVKRSLFIQDNQFIINGMFIKALQNTLSNNPAQDIRNIILNDLNLIYEINNIAYKKF